MSPSGAEQSSYEIKEGGEQPWDRRPGFYSAFERQMLIDRINDLKHAYRQFKAAKELEQGSNFYFFLNDEVAVIICGSFINDIKEFKLLHIPELGTDSAKRSAYIARWIAKLRPIQFDRKRAPYSPGEANNPELAFVNEDFATFVFYLFLKGFQPGWLGSPIVEELNPHLRHLFRKRDPDRDALVALASVAQAALSQPAAQQ